MGIQQGVPAFHGHARRVGSSANSLHVWAGLLGAEEDANCLLPFEPP